MVEKARSNRALENTEEEGNLVYIEKQLYDEIQGVLTQKGKGVCSITLFSIQGNASHLLKRSAKLTSNRKPAKQYPLHMRDLKEQEEEKQKEDDMA